MRDNEASFLAKLISNLCEINVIVWTEGTDDVLQYFEERFCFHPALQSFYTAEHLRILVQAAKPGYIYELVDEIRTGLLLFCYSGSVLVCGPYVKTEYNAANEEKILALAHLPASLAPALQLYYTKLPVLTTQTIMHVAESCLHSVEGEETIYTYRLLHGIRPSEEHDQYRLPEMETETYSEIYERYELENRFQNMIAAGNEEGAVAAYRAMGKHKVPREVVASYSFYHDIGAAMANVRTLARTAAEQGGLSVIEIDRIMQKTEQQQRKALSAQQYVDSCITMIRELSQGVRQTQERIKGCSAPVRKCLEYISLHYADQIRRSDLADFAGISPSHLSARFHEETGITLQECIMQTRCRAAAQLLIRTDLPIQEISSYVGYPDNNYFVKVFRRKYGMTPSAYRARIHG